MDLVSLIVRPTHQNMKNARPEFEKGEAATVVPPAWLRAAAPCVVSKTEPAARQWGEGSNAQIPVLQLRRSGQLGGAAGPDAAAAFEDVMAVGETQQLARLAEPPDQTLRPRSRM